MTQRAGKSSLNIAAENIGAALGQVAARLDKWRSERASIAADIRALLKSTRGMLGELDDEGEYVAAPRPPRNKGGRPKGYKTSAATKAKLRAAWKRRQSAMKNVKAGARAAKAGAKAFVRGKKKSADSGGAVGNG